MCLITNKNSKVLIAEEDMIVYKHVIRSDNDSCRSSMIGYLISNQIIINKYL